MNSSDEETAYDAFSAARNRISELLLFSEIDRKDLNDAGLEFGEELEDELRERKCYWAITKASRKLSKLASEKAFVTFLTHRKSGSSITGSLSSPEPLTASDSVGAVCQSFIAAVKNDSSASVGSAFSASASSPHPGYGIRGAIGQEQHAMQYRARLGSDDPNAKLSMQGFAAVKDFMQSSRARCPCFFSMGDLGIQEGWSTSASNVAYYFEDCPLQGWRKEISIRMSGKSRGSTDIHYIKPDRTGRLRARQDLQQYFTQNGISLGMMSMFEFRSAFCVCHEPEDSDSSYLECSYGLAGCNRWLHPECVGLGLRVEEELQRMPPVICPLCANYLRGTGELEKFRTPDMM